MKYIDFLQALDAARSKLRANHNLKIDEVTVNDSVYRLLENLLNEVTESPEGGVQPIYVETQTHTVEVDPLLSIAPVEEPPAAPRIVSVVDRGEGEGRMIVMGREKPFVPRKPILDEVFDEKELGK